MYNLVKIYLLQNLRRQVESETKLNLTVPCLQSRHYKYERSGNVMRNTHVTTTYPGESRIFYTKLNIHIPEGTMMYNLTLR